jgi:hypothetical protein
VPIASENPLAVSLNFLLCCQNNKFLVLHPTGDVQVQIGNWTILCQAEAWGQQTTPGPSLKSLTEGSYDSSNLCGSSRQNFKHNNGHKLHD